MTELTLAISANDHKALQDYLFPGDGLEAAAILICGRAGMTGERLCVRSVIPIPHNACSIRTPVRLNWPGEYLERAIDEADRIGGSIILTHSHPGGYFDFSNLDDESDLNTIPSLIYGSKDESISHGSAIMVPNGHMKARLYKPNITPQTVKRVWRLGSDIADISEKETSPVLAFSSEMTTQLSTMSACVVGASGTGSPTVEMLARMGFGRIVIVDFDKMEKRNLNRILNSSLSDATSGALKVDVLARSAHGYRPDIEMVQIAASISEDEAIIAASGTDVLFCCVDTMEGRLYCDRIAEACLIPLIDMGVMIPTRNRDNYPEIADVVARIDYVYPGGSTLWDRGEVTGEGLAAEELRRTNPETYRRHLEEGYIRGVAEEAPSVISLNMLVASKAVMEFIARVFPYRHEPNDTHDRIFVSLAACETEYELSDPVPPRATGSIYGQGLKSPLLGLAARVSQRKNAA